jgi:hypothetical protein
MGNNVGGKIGMTWGKNTAIVTGTTQRSGQMRAAAPSLA